MEGYRQQQAALARTQQGEHWADADHVYRSHEGRTQIGLTDHARACHICMGLTYHTISLSESVWARHLKNKKNHAGSLMCRIILAYRTSEADRDS